jgi:hypothetical protein
VILTYWQEIFILREAVNGGDEELDLWLSDDAQFSANKLRTQLERFYMGVVSQPFRSRIASRSNCLAARVACSSKAHVETEVLA